MAAENFIGNGPAGPEQISNDVFNQVVHFDEEARVHRIITPAKHYLSMPGYYQPESGGPQSGTPGPGSDCNPTFPCTPFQESIHQPPILQEELLDQLRDYYGGSSRHRAAATKDLADVVTQVNDTVLAPGLKLEPIKKAGELTVSSNRGKDGHSTLTINLDTGVISDQAGTHYLAKDQQGRLDFVPEEPLAINLTNGTKHLFDEKDNLTDVKLPDGSRLKRIDSESYQIFDSTGKPNGIAKSLKYDCDSTTYVTQNGVDKSLVVQKYGVFVSEDLKTGAVAAKRATDPGKYSTPTNPAEVLVARAVMREAAAIEGVTLPKDPVPTADPRKDGTRA